MIKLVLEGKKNRFRVVSCNAIFGLSHGWRIFKGNFEPVSPALQADSLLSEPPGKPRRDLTQFTSDGYTHLP